MYTLEDDNETSSHFRKRDILRKQAAQQPANTQTPGEPTLPDASYNSPVGTFGNGEAFVSDVPSDETTPRGQSLFKRLSFKRETVHLDETDSPQPDAQLSGQAGMEEANQSVRSPMQPTMMFPLFPETPETFWSPPPDSQDSREHAQEPPKSAATTFLSDVSPGTQAQQAAITLPVQEQGRGEERDVDPHEASEKREQGTGALEKLVPSLPLGAKKKIALAALVTVCVSVFFTALDQTVVVTALEQVRNDLQIPFTQLDHVSWIVSAYLLGFVVAMPLMGRVSDLYGRRRIFLLCLSIFGIGSLLCAVAPLLAQILDISFLGAIGIDVSSPGLTLLIAARFLQAIGGGAVVPVAMAVAGDAYGKKRLGLAIGIIGAVTEAGGALGPLYGAVIVQRLGWQYIFYLNIPIVLALLVATWLWIPKGRRTCGRIDWLGAILLGLALTCLSLGLAQEGTSLSASATTGSAPQNNPIALALSIVFLIAFVIVELRLRWPVVEVRLFRKFPFSATSLVSLFVGAALIIALADIPLFVDTVLQRTVLDSGLALLRLTALIPVGAILGGWLCERVSCRVTGVLGLLFTATGFYLMSRWPVHVDWTQITISTVTAGFGFGLVIAPIGTTAINAVRTTQAGMSSAVVTALRMVGMMLGLAALTSWALAYFKQLASTYRTLPTSATPAQFTAWSKGYAAHLVASAHTVYSAVFLVSMLLCLLAILPAIFLWGHKLPVAETEPEEAEQENELHDAETVPVVEPKKLEQHPKRRRRLVIACAALILLLIGGGTLGAFLFTTDDPSTSDTGTNVGDTTGVMSSPVTGAASGPRFFQLALDQGALTSVFASQLNLGNGALTDLNVTPVANDGLVLNLNLHIDANGIHRVMPVELDGALGVDAQQNLQLSVSHLKRDGQDAGPTAAANMQEASNQLLTGSVMPALRGQLKNAQLISAHTSTAIACGKGIQMLVLLIKAPAISGIAAQSKPVSLCFKGPVDLKNLLPH